MRIAVIASTARALAACSGQTDTSPGTVTLRLDLPSSQSFCDQVPMCGSSVDHITLSTLSGEPLQLARGCASLCETECQTHYCTAICPVGGGEAVTQVGMSWDGSYYEASTCGRGNSCVNQRYVPPGRYIAHMCATPGALDTTNAQMPTCTATGPQECVDVPFELPGPPLVEMALPGGAS